jgi:hypothetical protein
MQAINKRPHPGAVRHLLIATSTVLALILGAFLLNWAIPFNLQYSKKVKAQRLRDNVKEWQLRAKPEMYGYTNETEICYVWRTNLLVRETTVSIIMRLDSCFFHGRGSLLATEKQEVFWVGRNGTVEALRDKHAPTAERQ